MNKNIFPGRLYDNLNKWVEHKQIQDVSRSVNSGDLRGVHISHRLDNFRATVWVTAHDQHTQI